MTKPTLTTTVISDLAWEQLTNMDAPANSPIASTVAGVAPVQSWEETDQVLPDIGQVDNELLAAAGLSNTILISVKTEEVLKTITVSIGDNGNWFVGGEDTGVAAQGTNEASIARPTGVYGAASVFHVGNTLTIGAGLMYCVKEGQNFFTMQTTAELNISVDASTTFVTIDRTGTVRTYSSGINLWTIPESQALVALVVDTDGIVSSFAVPTVHNAMLMASAVIPYSQGAIEAASTATLQATIASQFASQAHQSADAAEAAKVITQADAAITTTNAQLAEQYKTDAQAAATSANQFADFADADRVATAADRAQVATDKAAVAADRSTVATDKGIVASDKAITLGYKNDAAASKNLAAEYAIKPENSVITGTVSDYSALHWAQKAQQWAQAVSSALVWKGQWSAASNTAPPTPAVGTGAHFYRISAAGTINSVTYEVGDYIHWDTVSLSWFKIDGTDAVMTVNGVSPVGGNVSITTITGNAGTATKLATARTIGGVSFNGTANINLPGVNAAGTQNTSGNAATATKLATARLIAGKSFDGTANITLAASDVGAAPAGYGLGAPLVTNNDADAIGIVSGFFGAGGAGATNFYEQYAPLIQASRAGGADGTGQLVQIQGSQWGIAYRFRNMNTWTAWKKFLLDAEAEAGSGAVMRTDGAKVGALDAAINKASFKNKVHNGKMEVSQRGTGLPIPILATEGKIDRFSCGNSTAARGTVNQSIVDISYPNPNIRKCLSVALTTAVETTIPSLKHLRIAHALEGYDIRELTAKPFVISFTAKSTKAGSYGLALRNGARTKTIVTEFTLPANVWTPITIAFSALPSGFVTDWENGMGMEICWTLAAATDLRTATLNTMVDGLFLAGPNQVAWGTSTSDTFQLTEVQLEVGTAKTEFEHRPYPVELALCQRYLLGIGWADGLSGTLASGGMCTASVAIVSIGAPVPMRATPTFEGGTLTMVSGGGVSGTGTATITLRGPTIMINQSITGAAGQSGYLTSSQTGGFRGFVAELV